MRKKNRVLPFLLATAVVTSPLAAVPNAYAISSLDIRADDEYVDEETTYTIDFYLDKDLDAGDNIYVEFPRDYDVSGVRTSDVTVDGREASRVSVSGGKITIRVPRDLYRDDKVRVEIDGVVNPRYYDDYTIKVSTTNESSRSATIYIDRSNSSSNSSRSDFSVEMDARDTNEKTSLKLGRIDLRDDLKKGDLVYVTFPDSSMLPSRIDTRDVEINGYEPDDVTISGKEVRIKVPKNADKDDTLDIYFSRSAGIKSPRRDDDYTIEVKYKSTRYTSEEFSISGSSGSASKDFKVDLSDNYAGAATSYTFEFDLGKKLKSNQEIEVEFPDSLMVPSTVLSTYVKINGETARSASVSGRKVTITTPFTFKDDSKIKVVFEPRAGITNPNLPGTYTLTVKAAGSTITSKSFEISGSRTGSVVNPTNPTNPTTVDNSTAAITFTKTLPSTATTINVGLNGLGMPLTKNQDFFEIAFPSGFRMPASFSTSSFTVNGLAPSYVALRGQNLVVYPAQDIPANQAVNVVIGEGANIVTPAAAGQYNLAVYTSNEKAPLITRSVNILPANAVMMKVGAASFTKGGVTKNLTTAPYTFNGNTLVPAQFFKDGLGLTTQWNNKTATITSGTTVIQFTVGSNQAKIGKTTVKLPVAVQLKDNMPMLPIRFVSDTLKYTLGWDAASSSIVMYK
ncbi:stalk domain-containing protein [Brevibacillus massiliensis]|uniref:stalk domain-containing protein n=1 Tax=Brevibacillus massiliensis TaxID=1118054 RepID=UPI0002EDFCB3|nr:stalk domain-containing protein [Brevibacillus massiliensis]